MSQAAATLQETFHVEQPLATVWRRLRLGDAPVVVGEHCRIPGFPSVDGEPGCLARVVVAEPQRALKATKADHPCKGSRIAIAIAPANAAGWPTRVSVAQSELPAAMHLGAREGAALPDAVHAHWRQIAQDFRLYLEREVALPAGAWGPDFGAIASDTPLGLELDAVAAGGFAERCGLRPGDLLLSLRGVRVRSLAQLWTVLALASPGETVAAAWVRGSIRTGSATL